MAETSYSPIDLTRACAPRAPARMLIPRRGGELASALFNAAALDHSLWWIAHDEFRAASPLDAAATLGEPVSVRSSADGDELEALLTLPSGALALLDFAYGRLTVEVAARSAGIARKTLEGLRDALTERSVGDGAVPFAFWTRSPNGGVVRYRDLEAPTIGEIAANYTASVAHELKRLAAPRATSGGALLLWRGPPGTGKTHAVRALARSWEPWYSTHVVIDPEELLAGGPYLLELLTHCDDEDSARLIVLEDAGELIARDARVQAGGALSRLLNLADGLIGQGTRTLILITTNEPVGALHPAVRRPGRCISDIEFGPLSVEEANAWLKRRGERRSVARPTTLAELYGSREETESAPGADPAFGFARALRR